MINEILRAWLSQDASADTGIGALLKIECAADLRAKLRF